MREIIVMMEIKMSVDKSKEINCSDENMAIIVLIGQDQSARPARV